MSFYCTNRYQSLRRRSREVTLGNLSLGGQAPLRIQSMTTTNPEDIEATVKQTLELADAGCEIVRITAPNVTAAKALETIKKKLIEAKCHVPLVADIHFLPQAAMEAALHVEKVRINPGNFADKKKFIQKTYTTADYEAEIERLHQAVTPLILRCKELGRCLRIGTNHGSLSDRILNYYGDTPLGMVESALEFIRIAESHQFYNLVLSMKASNPKVMIQAYRLAVSKMAEENMHYPLHLGVTEAGDGEDGRIKSAIGIGALLYDGLGDTLRVSLTENPIYEIPIAQALAQRAHALWKKTIDTCHPIAQDNIDPFSFHRRETITLNTTTLINHESPPRVIAPCTLTENPTPLIRDLVAYHTHYKDQPIEGLIIDSNPHYPSLPTIGLMLSEIIPFFFIKINTLEDWHQIETYLPLKGQWGVILNSTTLINNTSFLDAIYQKDWLIVLDIELQTLIQFIEILRPYQKQLIITASKPATTTHALGHYRSLAHILKEHSFPIPLWLRMTPDQTILNETHLTANILESSLFLGSLLCDGLGNLISLEIVNDFKTASLLTYNILQGARERFSKTEFVACPSCGRTLFNLETTTQKIREKTHHLKGVTIAIMGCIVNGPGEMADADFGYVGGAPGKVNLYVKKDCVQYNIPEAQAVDHLIALIKAHNRWQDPI